MVSDAERFAAFCKTYGRHVKGALAGTPVHLEQWQLDDWRLALELDPKTGLRKYRSVVFMRPKKHSKSLDASLIGYYLLSPYDGELGAEGYAAAGGKDQARFVHNVARTMADPTSSYHSPGLADLFTVQRNVITGKNGSTWQVVSAKSDLVEGANPHYASVDEYAIHKSPELRANLSTAMIARQQPFLFTISTVGADTSRPLYALEKDALKLPHVEKPTPYKTIAKDPDAGFLFIKYGLDENSDEDLENPEVINGVNVASWVTPDVILRSLKDPSVRESDVRRKHFNQWVADRAEGINPDVFDAGARPGLRIPDGTQVVVGVDVGLRDDYTAIVAAAQMPDNEIWYEHAIFAPPEGENQEIDLSIIERTLEAWARKWRVTAIAVDPFFLADARQRWVSRGLPIVEFPMYDNRIAPASLTYWKLLNEGRVRHDGDATYREHCLNAVMKDTARAWKFHKQADLNRKIDALIATLLATHTLISNSDGESVYENRGFFTL